MTDIELCKWLRENSSGIYRPSAEAALRIEELLSALQSICDIENKMHGADWDEIEEAREIARKVIGI